MKIKTYVEYYVSKRVSKEDERELDLQKFKDFVGTDPIKNEDELKGILQDFFWEGGDLERGDDKEEDWEVNAFYITDASELLPYFDITCCSSAARTDNYCRTCGKQLKHE